MLEIKNLNSSINSKEVLKNFNLNIKKGEVHVIMGPNGTGKSTLSKIIMGDKKYKIDGSINFLGEDITKSKTDEISKKGIFLAMQQPPEIDGVSNADFLRTALDVREEKVPLMKFIREIESATKSLSMKEDMVHRNINKGFSGGERKKNEILQMKILKPKLIILDEIDSGLDIDSLKIVSDNINDYLNENKDSSLLIITHYPRILEYIKPDFVHIMINGNIVKTGSIEIAYELEKDGFSKYKNNENNNEG